MEPACVETCPSSALYFGDLNDPESAVSRVTAQLEKEGALETLRPEKSTRPRVKFAVDEDHPMATWEPKIPVEGQSYHNDAYSVYSWGEPGFDGKRRMPGRCPPRKRPANRDFRPDLHHDAVSGWAEIGNPMEPPGN
jgi:hypothetical protein